MNTLKIQQELLKSLLGEGKGSVHYFDFDLERIFVTTDGHVGYILPEEELRVKLQGAQEMMSRSDDITKTVLLANRLRGTDEYRNGGVARKYLREDDLETAVYVDTGLLKNFNHPELYQAKGSPLGLIAVTENAIGSDESVIVGIVMPTKVNEEK